jgi:hypothetical protein
MVAVPVLHITLEVDFEILEDKVELAVSMNDVKEPVRVSRRVIRRTVAA